jgi:hypothetical protein
MGITLATAAAALLLFIGLKVMRWRKRVQAVRKFLEANPAAKASFVRLVKRDEERYSLRVADIATKTKGRCTVLITTFSPQNLQLAIDRDGGRFALCGGSWLEA